MAMKQRRRIDDSAEQRAEIWEHWKREDSVKSIGRLFGRGLILDLRRAGPNGWHTSCTEPKGTFTFLLLCPGRRCHPPRSTGKLQQPDAQYSRQRGCVKSQMFSYAFLLVSLAAHLRKNANGTASAQKNKAASKYNMNASS